MAFEVWHEDPKATNIYKFYIMTKESMIGLNQNKSIFLDDENLRWKIQAKSIMMMTAMIMETCT